MGKISPFILIVERLCLDNAPYFYQTLSLKRPPTVHELFANLSIILLLYLFLFQPPVVNKFFFVAIEGVIFLGVLLLRGGTTLKLLSQFKQELLFVAIIIVCALVRDMLSSEIVYSDRFIAWGFQAFLFSAVILLYFHARDISLFNALYWTSFIAAMLSFLLLLIPEFDQWYKSIQLDSYYERYENFEVRYRAYGISENLTFTYAFVMGMFSGYSLLFLRKSLWYIIPFIIFLIATVFNARIGLVPVMFFIGYILFVSRDHVTVLKFFVASVLVSVVVYFLLPLMGMTDISTLVIFSNLDWVLMFFTDLVGSGQDSSTLAVMFNDFIIIPESLMGFLFGTGESLFGKEHGSDMGFILQLNYAGFIFVLLIVSFILFCSYRLVRVLGIKHWFTSFFFCMVIVLNIKGFVFAATPGGRIVFLLYMYFIVQQNRKGECL